MTAKYSMPEENWHNENPSQKTYFTLRIICIFPSSLVSQMLCTKCTDTTGIY